MQIQKLTDRRHPDYKSGVRGYFYRVERCPVCGRDTNLVFYANGKYRFACSQKCADKR